MKHLLKVLMLAACLTSASLAQAALITYNFSGTLTSSLGTLTSGNAFSGSYTVDTAVPARALSTSTFAAFDNLTQVSLTIGGFSGSVGPGAGLPETQQDNVAGADRYGLLGRNATGSTQIAGLDLTTIGFRLDDTSGTAIADALLLVTDLNLSDFTSNTFLLFFEGPNTLEIVTGTLDRLTAVPEPGSLLLVALALIALAHNRRPHPVA